MEYSDRSTLWNAVEKCEKYKTAQLAREIEISLPVELSREQNIKLAREYVKTNFSDKGMCADLCIHDKNDGNPHFHLMLTMRPIEKDGTWGQKSRTENGKKVPTVDWNEFTKAEEWRKAWADILNQYLTKNEIAERVDHRSYKRQGVDEVPTVHMGVAASQMEKKGIRTDKGNRNRKIADINSEIRQTKARIKKVKTWLYAQPIQNAPSFISLMQPIADAKNLNSRWKRIADLKTQAKTLIFLQNNNITDMEHFVTKVTEISNELKDVTDKIKSTDRRLETLSLHLQHCENFNDNKAIYSKHRELAPKQSDLKKNQKLAAEKQKAYYEIHAEEIESFKSSGEYLKAVMNGKQPIPVYEWKKEQKNLTAERFTLAEKFYQLKDEIKYTEILRRNIEELMRGEVQREQKIKTQNNEL